MRPQTPKQLAHPIKARDGQADEDGPERGDALESSSSSVTTSKASNSVPDEGGKDTTAKAGPEVSVQGQAALPADKGGETTKVDAVGKEPEAPLTGLESELAAASTKKSAAKDRSTVRAQLHATAS